MPHSRHLPLDVVEMGDRPSSTSSVETPAGKKSPRKAYQGMVFSHHEQAAPTTQAHISTPSPNPQSQHGQHGHAQEHGSSNLTHFNNGQAANTQAPFNMSAMANTLPSQGYHPAFSQQPQRHNQSPRYFADPQHTNMYNAASQMPQYPVQPFYLHPQSQMSPYFGHQQMPGVQGHQTQHSSGSPRSNPVFYQGNMMNQHNPTAYYYHPHMNPYGDAVFHSQMPQNSRHYGRPNGPGGRDSPQKPSAQQTSAHMNNVESADGNGAAQFSVVRGPPRKPRQSGHAIWIGNLPPQTELMSLVRHVCRETPGLESVFLISKSSCAFANFKDEESCVAAQQKLHDSKFQSVRLVSRLRKNTVEGAGGQTAPTGPASTSPAVQLPTGVKEIALSHEAIQDVDQPTKSKASTAVDHKPTQLTERVFLKDRFFVLKSLTVEDLELSVRNGVWATQSHNEENLNKAFETAGNVYLVFSANKSGEYFGYARMTSPINDDPAAAIKFAPKVHTTDEMDVPKSIPTEAVDECPKGRIIDDSSRGTIFWEVDRGDDEVDCEDARLEISEGIPDPGEIDGETKAWGKPFQLEWQSTTKLPFYRTRGLRNAWNSNRDVKIARDGTELETIVGKKLIGLFNRIQSPAPHMQMGFRQDIQLGPGFPPPSYR